jgi:hypothetical protein
MSNDNCKPEAVTKRDLHIVKMAMFGERVWRVFTDNIDSLDVEAVEEVMEIAASLGMAKQVAYNPETHGDIDGVRPGGLIWWWGDGGEL